MRTIRQVRNGDIIKIKGKERIVVDVLEHSFSCAMTNGDSLEWYSFRWAELAGVEFIFQVSNIRYTKGIPDRFYEDGVDDSEEVGFTKKELESLKYILAHYWAEQGLNDVFNAEHVEVKNLVYTVNKMLKNKE